MTTGLYFPHTSCNDKPLLKSALFLFDKLEYIVPWKEYHVIDAPNDPQIRRAIEIIGRPIVPTSSEQEQAHKEIEQVCKGRIASKLNFKPSKTTEKYLIFPQKFDQRTWELLKNKKLIKQLGEEFDHDFSMTVSLGHFMMAMLSLCCSGTGKQLVTDTPDAFKALYIASADDIRGNSSTLEDARHRLLNIRTKSFDFSQVSFSRLLDLREREDAFLTELRTNYYKVHKECLSEIEKVSDNAREIRYCIEQYTSRAENDLKELKKALCIQATTTLLSKTVISTVAGVASEALLPSSGFLASAAVLTGQLADYRDKRRKLLKSHNFAWLYEAQSRFKLY